MKFRETMWNCFCCCCCCCCCCNELPWSYRERAAHLSFSLMCFFLMPLFYELLLQLLVLMRHQHRQRRRPCARVSFASLGISSFSPQLILHLPMFAQLKPFSSSSSSSSSSCPEHHCQCSHFSGFQFQFYAPQSVFGFCFFYCPFAAPAAAAVHNRGSIEVQICLNFRIFNLLHCIVIQTKK